MKVEMRRVAEPDLAEAASVPEIPRAVYLARIESTLGRMAAAGLDALIVYGDREHYGNLAYLTGYDPRFEESLLVLTREGVPHLLIGNEGEGYVGISPLQPRTHLYQSLSLVDQDRSKSPWLEEILSECGVRPGMRVGLAGWKFFVEGEVADPSAASELPSFIVDAIRRAVGDEGALANATALFIDGRDGLRTDNEAVQIAAFEATQSWASVGIWQAIGSIRAGVTEHEIARQYGYRGQPLDYHPIVTSGERTKTALASASARTLADGDPVFLAFGGWGANTVRAGFVAAGASGLPADQRDYGERVVHPYVAAFATWYQSMRIGVTCGEIVRAVHDQLGGAITHLALNPGHHIHVDEWVSSPFHAGSTVPIRSGMVIQMDMIPVTAEPYFSTNAEDGIAIADEALRERLASEHPDAWARIQVRRRYMAEELGIRLADEALPLSAIQGILPPYLLDPTFVPTVSA
jgi:Xaa-Pro aminopeptidase